VSWSKQKQKIDAAAANLLANVVVELPEESVVVWEGPSWWMGMAGVWRMGF